MKNPTKIKVRIGNHEVEGEFPTAYDAAYFLKEFVKLAESARPAPKKPAPFTPERT